MEAKTGNKIDILLSTYNGGRYLDAQLQSLFDQAATGMRILIRDDGSSDDTKGIIERWRSEHPVQIRVLQDSTHTGDPGANFLELLCCSDADYAMFCDQDDIWLPEKVNESLRAMRRVERDVPGMPLLLHTDLIVSDAALNPLSTSFMRYQKLNPKFRSLERLTVQNNVTGCTVLLNRALREIMRRPAIPVLHDWWAALTAAAFGRILYLDKATVCYRQHSFNAVGAKDARGLAGILSRVDTVRSIRAGLERTYDVAGAFLETYADALNEAQTTFLRVYSSMRSLSAAGRFRTLRHHQAFKNGFLRSAAQVLLG